MTPERHSASLRPECFNNLGEKSIACFEGEQLSGWGEEEGTTLVRDEAGSLFEDRMRMKAMLQLLSDLYAQLQNAVCAAGR